MPEESKEKIDVEPEGFERDGLSEIERMFLITEGEVRGWELIHAFREALHFGTSQQPELGNSQLHLKTNHHWMKMFILIKSP
jgi:hypothetical protein